MFDGDERDRWAGQIGNLMAAGVGAVAGMGSRTSGVAAFAFRRLHLSGMLAGRTEAQISEIMASARGRGADLQNEQSQHEHCQPRR